MSTRPNLKLDEESFQALLAAAFTVQEHNARRQRTGHIVCPQCGSLLDPERRTCPRCDAPHEVLRPGELMQRKWASLWMMSQKQRAHSDTSAPRDPARNALASTTSTQAESHVPFFPDETALPEEQPEIAEQGIMADVSPRPLVLAASQLAPEPFEDAELQSSPASGLSIVLRFRREDLYLGLAILVSAFALLWAIWAAPVTRGWEKARLNMWQRTLVKLGIAEETPRAPVVYRGDPSVKVWADPHTALYYCYGDEQFGKTPDGHFSSQGEAQMDRFLPAQRAPCE